MKTIKRDIYEREIRYRGYIYKCNPLIAYRLKHMEIFEYNLEKGKYIRVIYPNNNYSVYEKKEKDSHRNGPVRASGINL